MKTKNKVCFVFLTLLCLASCKSVNNYPGTSTFDRTKTSTFQSPGGSQTISTLTNRFLPLEIEGETIFMGLKDGEYILYDIDKGTSKEYTLFEDCKILQNGKSSICKQDGNIFAVDLLTGDQTNLQIPSANSWRLTSDQKKIIFTTKDNDNNFGLFVFNPSERKITKLATINYDEWPVFPKYFDTDGILVGGQLANSNIILSEINILDNKVKPIELGNSGYITDLAWSPTKPIIGIGSTDNNYQDISRCATNNFSTYNFSTGEYKQIIRAPQDECFEYFDTYARNIWSPDGSMVALIEDQQVCLVNIEETKQNCYEVAHVGENIQKITWSPDSHNIAVIIGNPEIRKLKLGIISSDNRSPINFIKSFDVYSKIYDFVWTKP